MLLTGKKAEKKWNQVGEGYCQEQCENLMGNPQGHEAESQSSGNFRNPPWILPRHMALSSELRQYGMRGSGASRAAELLTKEVCPKESAMHTTV